MPDKRLLELLTRKMAGELSPTELLELNELLSLYPAALQEEDLLKQIWSSKLPPEDAPFHYEQHRKKYSDALYFDDVNEPVTARSKWSRQYTYPGVLSMLLLTVASLYFVSTFLPGKDAYKQIIAGKGVRKMVYLPDGTKVWLNADSKLSYDPQMNQASTRLISLEGEAFFDVAHDKAHPFLINAGKVCIKVLGTAFNVRAYPTDKKCETTLIRGSVELTLNDGSKQKIILKPSEKLALIENEEGKGLEKNDKRHNGKTLLIELVNPVKVEDKEYVPETSWTENRIMFENETMQEIAVKLERWYNVKIEIDSKAVALYHFTGSFTNETLEQVLTAMQLIKSFNFKTTDHDITIY